MEEEGKILKKNSTGSKYELEESEINTGIPERGCWPVIACRISCGFKIMRADCKGLLRNRCGNPRELANE